MLYCVITRMVGCLDFSVGCRRVCVQLREHVMLNETAPPESKIPPYHILTKHRLRHFTPHITKYARNFQIPPYWFDSGETCACEDLLRNTRGEDGRLLIPRIWMRKQVYAACKTL